MSRPSHDGDRFRTVVSNELHTIHTEKNLHEHIADEEFDEVFEQYIQYFKENIGRCAWKNSTILLKCYNSSTSLFEVFD